MNGIDLCPCCGDYAYLLEDTNSILNYYGYPCWYIQCANCGLKTTKGEQEEVILKWNRRYYKHND